MLSGEVTLENGTHTVYSVTVSELNDNNGVTPLDIQGIVTSVNLYTSQVTTLLFSPVDTIHSIMQ